MEPSKLVERIFDHVENRDADRAARAALRLSRLIGDHMSTALFLRELVEDRHEIARVLFDDTSHLKEDAQKYLYEKSFERWLKSRTLPFSFASAEDEERNVVSTSVGELLADLEQCEKSISDLAIPPNMGEYDSAAFTDRYSEIKGGLRLRIRALETIRSRVLNQCQNFAISVERQLLAQEKTSSFLERAQNDVQNYFRARSEDVYQKLQKANQLVDSASKEDLSLLLTQVRRAIKAVADHFYPPIPGVVVCSDGVERVLGEEQYLNRLHEFVHSTFSRSTSTDLLRAELDHLIAFARKLNDVSSKGVHADVTMPEAQQGFVGLYMFLFNITTRLQTKNMGND